MGFQQGFRINTNTSSLDTYRNYSASQAGMERNIERLSSGLRINKAADDSAGLSISNRMDNQVRGMQQANRNVQQGNNMLQTAEGAMNEIGNILGRMRELAVQSASDTMNTNDRSSIDLEFEQLKAEITRIADSTEYNNEKLIDGTQASLGEKKGADGGLASVNVAADTAQAGKYTITTGTNSVTLTSDDGRSQTLDTTAFRYDTANDGIDDNTIATGSKLNFSTLGVTLEVGENKADISALDTDGTAGSETGDYFEVTAGVTTQVGADNAANNRISFGLQNLTAESDSAMAGLSGTDLSGLGAAQSAITTLDSAIDTINDARGNVGALQNRLEYTSSNLMNSVQNNAASMSTIRDADFAAEAADLAKNQILVQSGTAMLAQANGLSQNVLALIR